MLFARLQVGEYKWLFRYGNELFQETDSGKCTLDYGVFTRGGILSAANFRIGPYIVYFWSNENEPLEPVHVHIAEGRATSNATKVWITSTGKALLSHNSSKYQPKF